MNNTTPIPAESLTEALERPRLAFLQEADAEGMQALYRLWMVARTAVAEPTSTHEDHALLVELGMAIASAPKRTAFDAAVKVAEQVHSLWISEETEAATL